MTTDETGFPEHISELAREHGRAAITVLAEIMTQEDAPAGVRVTAAKALLERGWGKPGKPPDDGNRVRPVTKIVRRVIDPKRSEQEKPSANSAPRGQTEPSGVLLAMGTPRATALGAVRFSLGRWTTGEEVDQAVTFLVERVSHLRGKRSAG